jgi:hypothetical protein
VNIFLEDLQIYKNLLKEKLELELLNQDTSNFPVEFNINEYID